MYFKGGQGHISVFASTKTFHMHSYSDMAHVIRSPFHSPLFIFEPTGQYQKNLNEIQGYQQ